jgi:cell division inhibitor SulA
MSAVDAIADAAVPSLEAMLSAQSVWRAGRAPVAAAGGEPTGHAALDALLPQGGWPRRALTELLLPADGVGELSLLLPTLARMTQAGEVVAVVAPPYLPYAPAWQAAGVDLRFLEIVDADARGALWAFEQCLRSAACAAVLGWPLHADARALRRLQVAADSGGCLGFAFRDSRHAANPSPAALRLERVGGAWRVRKCRGGNVPARAFADAAAGAGVALAGSPVGATGVATFPQLSRSRLPSLLQQQQQQPPPLEASAAVASAGLR